MPSFVKTKEDERLWVKAKGRAAEAGQKENYAYITGIYKRMKGGKVAADRVANLFLERQAAEKGKFPVSVADREKVETVSSERVAAAHEAAKSGKWTVYIFSDTGKTLFQKTFQARDKKDAEKKALVMVKPQLRKLDDVDDWVIEPA